MKISIYWQRFSPMKLLYNIQLPVKNILVTLSSMVALELQHSPFRLSFVSVNVQCLICCIVRKWIDNFILPKTNRSTLLGPSMWNGCLPLGRAVLNNPFLTTVMWRRSSLDNPDREVGSIKRKNRHFYIQDTIIHS